MPFPDLEARVADVCQRIEAARARGGHGQRVEIVAVTKSHGVAAIDAVAKCGIRRIGENRVQEALAKMPQTKADVEWHLIGHLQRNKVKHLDSFAMLHSLDSPRLADEISAFGVRRGRKVGVLVQVNASGEASKGGYAPEGIPAEAERLTSLQGIAVLGTMTMAPFDAGEALLRETFSRTRAAGRVLRDAGHPSHELSMGMSDDYEVAVEEGATLVRLGTILFGARES
ncbi:MAG: YggS family pyridoxal phosphate-dependent enzyme [Gemmatimonadaceae bacterium]